MLAFELPIVTGEDACRLVRALGAHRYVAGSSHDVHAFAVDAASSDPRFSQHEEILAWAKVVLGDRQIDSASRDERLYRRLPSAVLADLLLTFWVDRIPAVAQTLASHLDRIEASYADLPAFDPAAEKNMFPILVDAGWELLRYAELDRERHKGLVESFGESILFEGAKFNEESAVPPPAYLYEWPALGRRELLLDTWEETPDLWVDAPEPYLDYLMRGVFRAAKLS